MGTKEQSLSETEVIFGLGICVEMKIKSIKTDRLYIKYNRSYYF